MASAFHEPESRRPLVTASAPDSSCCQKAERSGAPGEAAGHAHNRNTVVLALYIRLWFWLGLHLGWRGGRSADFAEFLDEMVGETGDVRVVKYHSVGYHVLIGKRAVQPVSQFYRHQRVPSPSRKIPPWARVLSATSALPVIPAAGTIPTRALTLRRGAFPPDGTSGRPPEQASRPSSSEMVESRSSSRGIRYSRPSP